VTDALTHAEQSSWDVELNLIGPNQQTNIRCPVNALPITPVSISSCTTSGIPLIWFDDGESGSIDAISAGSFLEIQHRFKFPDSWDDESSAVIAVNFLAPTGPMLPVSASFGLGNDQGVENDISLESWSVLSSNGIRSSHNHNYLRAGDFINVEVVLGFEGANEGTPRTGQALVRFMVDGTEYATTSSYSNGVALFPYSIPTGRTSIDLGVEVIPLRGQSVVNEVETSFTFLFDNIAPTLISSDVERFDHRDSSPVTSLAFTISDRPHLPTHAKSHIWSSWMDDANQDGVMDLEEIQTLDLTLPENLTLLMDEYLLYVDTSDAVFGDYFIGWLEVADSAGHMMADSGSPSSPLFHVQINDNGAPSLGAATVGWEQGVNPWIHPGETNTINVPIGKRMESLTLQKSIFRSHQIRRLQRPSHGTKQLEFAHLLTISSTWNRVNLSRLKQMICFQETEHLKRIFPLNGAMMQILPFFGFLILPCWTNPDNRIGSPLND